MAVIQWFPGHMAKTNRELTESVRLSDIVIEVLDARIPRSSGNPDFQNLFREKRRLIVLNKSDLADESVSSDWKAYYRARGMPVVFTNARDGKGFNAIVASLKALQAEKVSKHSKKGVVTRPLRAIVAGIPNSGKSSLINRLTKAAPAVTGDRPGITRRRQWFRVGDGLELLDTPGILWPKFDDEIVGLHLAFTGAIKDEVYDNVQAAGLLLLELCGKYPGCVEERYGIRTSCEDGVYEESLIAVGRRRGYLLRGGEVDVSRTAVMLLDEFRAGKIGCISLERPAGR